MNNKKLIQKLGFIPKENTSGIFQKIYDKCSNYKIEIDFDKEIINFGNKIKGESKTTQNFSQAENWVVLECVDRLLEKGYKPQSITLEKTWKTGHGTSGRLDILVSSDDNSAYLMIECKNWGIDFEKEFKNLGKNGGQLFTYFQQDKNASVLMLYTSAIDGDVVKYRNEIIKIEDDYRQAGNVKDFYERWNKLPKSNGVFDNWVNPYEFQSKALTRNDLKALKQEDSSFIFNRFLEILRHNVVSDKPNAFNKIFTLFLCKIVDEDRNADEQLHFQWLEGEDDHIKFQKRLTDLYNRGMLELLEKKVTDVSDSEFDKQFQQVEDQYKDRFREILTEIRLKKNNEFAIKEVYDDASFEENAKVVKEVVELLQVYQIRYNYRQQFLSDFFELLLTTGLKQESGQFFTPVPIARFIIKSLPFQEITKNKIEQGNKNDLLPTIIDYAAGSGHFITESMEVVQQYIDGLDENKFNPTAKKSIKKWKEDQFDWAENYVYGIEKDYRLVKTAKVSCYLHGDGLAKVIHGDGLGDFSTSLEFKDLLKQTDKAYPQDNKQFDVVISNPPYSVSAFKGSMIGKEKAEKAFDLYSRLTDQSSEIECLFIERTKQLLKDGGVAGIILPTSILDNNSVLNIQAREIILKYFDILAITELGSGTFMATGINTITLFLRRRNNADAINIEEAIKKVFTNLNDVTINGIEKPLHKYVTHVWDGITVEDYISLLKKDPNTAILDHEIYQEYLNKIKAKTVQEQLENILALEHDKLLYFIIAFRQKIVLVKTGEKSDEKNFLGYEFSNRRGSEGIHAVKRGKTIDECTQLYDAEGFENFEKASTYIYKAFKGNFDLDIPESISKNIEYLNLVDLLDFQDVTFDKKIKKITKANIKYEELWGTRNLVTLVTIADVKKGKSITKAQTVEGNIPVIAGGQNPAYYHNESNREGNILTVSASGAYSGFINYFSTPIFASDCNTIKSKDEELMPTRLLYHFLKVLQPQFYQLQRGQAQPHVYGNDIEKVKIPSFADKKIIQKILNEIDALDEKSKTHVVSNIEKKREAIIRKYI
ncbi:N-6 DNA methylase [Flavobacterium ginsenosidimutans]|uniref:N-6 DNA methylase n=1 Tax=Flavobacterium ginsenosidimutans TaxID=687844 RepID=UPI003D95448C